MTKDVRVFSFDSTVEQIYKREKIEMLRRTPFDDLQNTCSDVESDFKELNINFN
jgi:hypothetical protein